MSQIRHSELFASQDWKVLYRAFSQVNFNATDPASINQALREYIRANYPEDFNDWIESSEFVAIIDLLSWLAGTLAFKVDINARENFLETAQARESVLRLARFLSYNPSRARPASGLLKLIEVSTDDDVTDATGRSLTGQAIRWNNVDDRDWFEKFTTVLNAAFVSTNPYGTPLKNGVVSEVATQLYRLNGRMGENDFHFNTRVSGQTMDFELCNMDFDDGELHYEREPNPDSAFHMSYRSDGNGNSSPDTGFFCLFKQGQTKTQAFSISSPVENQLLNIDSSNVSEDDVWVQSINSKEQVLKKWTRVPSVYSDNVTFNSLSTSERDIYSVITRDDDAISLRFSDGYFGNAPSGTIQVTYRTVNGQRYTIKPLDISRVKVSFNYTNRRGIRRTLSMMFSLYSQVGNATTRETEAQVKRRAPAVYSTQGRMVSGEDYNLFPMSSNLAVKLKAVNRIYAGHSRHIDLNDPTSTYQDTNVFADDGIIFEEPTNYYEEVPISLNRSPVEIVTHHIQPMLKKPAVRQRILSEQVRRAMDGTNANYVSPPVGSWVQATSEQFSSTGHFTADYTHVKAGATLLFQLPDMSRKWVAVAEVNGAITVAPETLEKGPVVLAESIPTGSTVIATLPTYEATLSSDIYDVLEEKIDLGLSFTLWFDPLETVWLIDEYSALAVDANPPSAAAIKVASVEQVGTTLWKLSARGESIVFESARKVHWYADGEKVVDGRTGARKIDTIAVLGTNPDIDSDSGASIKEPSIFNTSKMYYSLSGKHEPRRINLAFVDEDEDGGYDHPNAFHRLVSTEKHLSTLFWKLDETQNFVPITSVEAYADKTLLPELLDSGVSGRIAYDVSEDTFYKSVGTKWAQDNRRNYRVARGRGFNVAASWTAHGEAFVPSADPLHFHWKHYANTEHRIDPSRTNIIDMFVLSNEYDFLTRQWIANGSKASEIPTPPSELDLRLTFRNYEAFKMFTDEIVWRPVRYKALFGTGSEDANLRAKFKVVKLPNTTASDGEIKSRVIRAINDFFDVNRWDFGETFYFTELAAYVHQQLAAVIGSFVIVPLDEDASFGDVFEVSAQPDEIFISTAQVSDVEIIASNSAGNLRIR